MHPMHPAETTAAITSCADPPNVAKQEGTCKDRIPLSCLVDLANVAFASHNRTNGSTASFSRGDMKDEKLFVVSIYPDRTEKFVERPTWQELFEFAKANLYLLSKPDHALGTWFNDYDLVHIVDVVICIPDRDVALELGRRFNQLAIFDLESRREIPILRAHQESTAKLAEVGNA
jgi:hypothetical protein